MEKKVFISHSSEDKKIANQICVTLENSNIGCWIAPRDIPYGNEWAGEITRALKNSKICVFLFSENSNRSRQVAREIQIAIDNEIVVIPIRVDNTEMNDDLSYYLTTLHWILVFNEIELLERIEQILQGEKSEQVEQKKILIVFCKKIDDLFPDHEKDSGMAGDFESTYLKHRIAQKYIKELANSIEDIKEDCNKSDGETKIEDITNDKHSEYGKHFTLVDKDNQTTLVFAINSILDVEQKVFSKNYMEELDWIIKSDSNGYLQKTFYIDYLHYYGIPIITNLVILTFCKENCCVYINNGVVLEESVKISKTPEITFWNMDGSPTGPVCNYTIDNKTLNIEMEAGCESDIIIIGLENFEVVKRNKKYNQQKSKWEAKIKLDIGKEYFVAKIKADNIEVDDITIALGYLHGLWGLPCDIMKAIDVLQSNGSAKAHFILAKIFRNNKLLRDDEDYIYYLSQAAKQGHLEAMMLLSNEYIDGLVCEQNYTGARELLKNAVEQFPQYGTAWNDLAWLYKKGFGCKQDLNIAKELFEKASRCGCKIAYRYLSQIALLSKGQIIDYNNGLYYLCCAERLGVSGLKEIFEQYSERLLTYQDDLDICQRKALDMKFEEYEIEKVVVENVLNSAFLVGGFPMLE